MYFGRLYHTTTRLSSNRAHVSSNVLQTTRLRVVLFSLTVSTQTRLNACISIQFRYKSGHEGKHENDTNVLFYSRDSSSRSRYSHPAPLDDHDRTRAFDFRSPRITVPRTCDIRRPRFASTTWKKHKKHYPCTRTSRYISRRRIRFVRNPNENVLCRRSVFR